MKISPNREMQAQGIFIALILVFIAFVLYRLGTPASWAITATFAAILEGVGIFLLFQPKKERQSALATGLVIIGIILLIGIFSAKTATPVPYLMASKKMPLILLLLFFDGLATFCFVECYSIKKKECLP